MFRRLAIAACLLVLGGTAHADDPVATYAIVVGSNSGGPGQIDLHYAEDDARRVAAVLTELGGYTAAQVDVVVHPTPDQLRQRIAALETRVEADVAAGRQARVFFYYSGHARAQAIDLGSSELPLTELRERLFKVPATLTVVVLDACQSGAFSRIKGAAPAADFSYSSRQHLDAAGIAVLASSSGSELSQESEKLHGSYFTHNLLVGLRGAGDTNNDGQVTIDEAYRYAYNQTLIETTETAVGGQHVTFEADLKGHGDVPLSYPRAATASIVLPAGLTGQALVSDHRARSVVAEIQKAKGAPIRIAVAPGEYDVIVTEGDNAWSCEVVAPGEIDLGRCDKRRVSRNATKGGAYAYAWRVEVGANAGTERNDGYTTNLENFGYQQQAFGESSELQITVMHRIGEYLYLGGELAHSSMPDWVASVSGEGNLMQTLSWNTTTASVIGRRNLPLLFDDRLGLYYEAMVGIGMGISNLKDTTGATHSQTNFGPAFAANAGVFYETRLGLGALVGYELDAAPVIKDLIGNTHDVGGSRFAAALSYRF
jgi:hypothetical protein